MALIVLDKVLFSLIVARVLLFAALLHLNSGAVLLTHFEMASLAYVTSLHCAHCIALSQICGDTGKALK